MNLKIFYDSLQIYNNNGDSIGGLFHFCQ